MVLQEWATVVWSFTVLKCPGQSFIIMYGPLWSYGLIYGLACSYLDQHSLVVFQILAYRIIG